LIELEGVLEGTGIEWDEIAGTDELGTPVLQGTEGVEEDE
jgi:hypothetical protein